MIKKFRQWCLRQALKDKSINEAIERRVRNESIAYNLWVSSLHKHGFPLKESGAVMDCWDLWDYYSINQKRDIYIKHADTV